MDSFQPFKKRKASLFFSLIENLEGSAFTVSPSNGLFLGNKIKDSFIKA